MSWVLQYALLKLCTEIERKARAQLLTSLVMETGVKQIARRATSEVECVLHTQFHVTKLEWIFGDIKSR